MKSLVILCSLLPILVISACSEEKDTPVMVTMTGGTMTATGGMMQVGTGGTPASGGAMEVTGGAMTGGSMMPATGGTPIAAAKPCSAARTTPGCDDPAVQECVCAASPECCATAWDVICVTLVNSLACKGDCCEASGSMGCNDATVEMEVCQGMGASPQCCSEGWDEFCTVVAEVYGADCQ